ncbi:unnamed protein product [Cunninghamella echinulata]
MAFAIPVLVGAPIGYFTWSLVCKYTDYQVINAFYNDGNQRDTTSLSISQKLEEYPPRSFIASTIGSVVSFTGLSKVIFPPPTRHCLFFAKAPPNTNIRMETVKMGLELLLRSGVVFYGTAVGGAITGRLVTGGKTSSSPA